jgi:hypothetical protein
MAIDYKAAETAAAAAQEAARAAREAQSAAEVEWLGSVKKISEISTGRTAFESNRLKSLYIKAFGFDRWQRLVADSR